MVEEKEKAKTLNTKGASNAKRPILSPSQTPLTQRGISSVRKQLLCSQLHLFRWFFSTRGPRNGRVGADDVCAAWYPPLFSASLSARWHRWLRRSTIEPRSLVKLAFEQPGNSEIVNIFDTARVVPSTGRDSLVHDSITSSGESVFGNPNNSHREATVKFPNDDRTNANVIHDRSSKYQYRLSTKYQF